MLGKDVTVNGVSVRPPKTYSGNGLTLERAGLFLVLLSQTGLTVFWDGGEAGYEVLPSHMLVLTQSEPLKSSLLSLGGSPIPEEHLKVAHLGTPSACDAC